MYGCHRFFLIAPLPIREVLRPNIYSKFLWNTAYSRLKLHLLIILYRNNLVYKPRLVSSSFKVSPAFCQIPQKLDIFTYYLHISSYIPKKPPWFIFPTNYKIHFKAQHVLISIEVSHNCVRILHSLECLMIFVSDSSFAPWITLWLFLGIINSTYYPYKRTRPSDKVLTKFCNLLISLGKSSIHLLQNSFAKFRPRWQVRILDCTQITLVWTGTACSPHTITTHNSKLVPLPPLWTFLWFRSHCMMDTNDGKDSLPLQSQTKKQKSATQQDLDHVPACDPLQKRMHNVATALSSLFQDAETADVPYIDHKTIFTMVRSADPSIKQSVVQHAYAKQVGAKRITDIEVPAMLASAISDCLHEAMHHKEHLSSCILLGMCWSLLRAFCESERLKLLDHDESFLVDPIKRLPLPVAKVNDIRAQIQQLTAARQSSVLEVFHVLHDKVALQLLRPEACALALQRIRLQGDDASVAAPQFLTDQLQNLRTGKALALSISLPTTGGTWSDPQFTKGLFGDSPAITKPPAHSQRAIWELPHLAPVQVTGAVPPPPPINFTTPRTVSTEDVLQHKHNALRNCSTLTDAAITADLDMPDQLLLNLNTAEDLLITGYLAVHNFRPVTNLPTASDNKSSTWAEAKHIVRSIGLLSESITVRTQLRFYENGLRLDDHYFRENYTQLWDDYHHIMLLKLTSVAKFGTAIFHHDRDPAHHVFPLYQEVLSELPRIVVRGKPRRARYYMQAVPEETAERLLGNRRLLASFRGIPHGANCSPLTSTCLTAVPTLIRAILTPLDGYAEDLMTMQSLTPVISTIPHYLRLSKSNNTTRGMTAECAAVSESEAGGPPPRFGVPTNLPLGIFKVEEVIINVIWTGEVTPRHLALFDNLRKVFRDKSRIPLNVCGIILEILASPDACMYYKTHLKVSSYHLPMTAVSNISPYTPLRMVYLLLQSTPTYWQQISQHLRGLYILPGAKRENDECHPWLLIAVWSAKDMYLRLDLLARCATRTTDGEPLSLCRYAYPTNSRNIPGLLDFHRLEQTYSTRPAPNQDRSSKATALHSSHLGYSRSSARPGNRQRRTDSQRTPSMYHARPAPILFMPDESSVADYDQSSISHQSDTADDSDYCEDDDDDNDYEVGTGVDDPTEEPPMDTDNVVSALPDSSLNLNSMAVMTDAQLVALGTTDPTISILQRIVATQIKPFQEKLDESSAVLEETKSALDRTTAELSALTLQSSDTLRINTRTAAQQCRRLVEERQSLTDDIASLEESVHDLNTAGSNVPQSILRKLHTARSTLERRTQDISLLRTEVEDNCIKLGVPVSVFLGLDDVA